MGAYAVGTSAVSALKTGAEIKPECRRIRCSCTWWGSSRVAATRDGRIRGVNSGVYEVGEGVVRADVAWIASRTLSWSIGAVQYMNRLWAKGSA